MAKRANAEITPIRNQPSNGLKITLNHLKTFQPLTDNQKMFFDYYKRGDYFMGLFGSPGVGKTFLSLYKALEEVLDKSNPFETVVVVRSAVAATLVDAERMVASVRTDSAKVCCMTISPILTNVLGFILTQKHPCKPLFTGLPAAWF